MSNWIKVLNAARNTVNKGEIIKEPSSEWKRKMLLAEHSPIRLIKLDYTWQNIKSWISVHFVRHKVGIEHFVSTQRDDRTKIDRNKSTQDSPVNHYFEVNAQAAINISRKRLCFQAHKETRDKWKEFLETKAKFDEPELYSVCVPECIYRGFCPEINPCGFSKTEDFKNKLELYRNEQPHSIPTRQ